jgi:hypothetical protein
MSVGFAAAFLPPDRFFYVNSLCPAMTRSGSKFLVHSPWSKLERIEDFEGSKFSTPAGKVLVPEGQNIFKRTTTGSLAPEGPNKKPKKHGRLTVVLPRWGKDHIMYNF